MATAEFAVALPALVLAAATAMAGVIAMTDELRCSDAAATAARMAAQGDAMSDVRSTALRAAPRGASLVVSIADGVVTVTVTDRVGGSGVLGRLPALTLRQHSVAALEPGVTGDSQ
jgi:Flp pilus assembly protein TadG